MSLLQNLWKPFSTNSFEEAFEEHQEWVEDGLENRLQDKPTKQSQGACIVLPKNIELKTEKLKIGK